MELFTKNKEILTNLTETMADLTKRISLLEKENQDLTKRVSLLEEQMETLVPKTIINTREEQQEHQKQLVEKQDKKNLNNIQTEETLNTKENEIILQSQDNIFDSENSTCEKGQKEPLINTIQRSDTLGETTTESISQNNYEEKVDGDNNDSLLPDYSQSYIAYSQLVENMNALITKCAKENNNTTNVDKIRNLYTQFSELTKDFNNTKIDIYIKILSNIDDNIQDYHANFDKHVKNEERNYKHLKNFLGILGCDIIKPKIGDPYDENIMNALNLDEVDTSLEIIVKTLIAAGYTRLNRTGQTEIVQRCDVYVENKEQNSNDQSR